MVQINLPDNSKVEKGKYFKDKTGSKNLRKVNVYRWDPSLTYKEANIFCCSSKSIEYIFSILPSLCLIHPLDF